jgi:hypothetical protein
MPLTIVEVIGRSEQGRTEPYICRCDDGEVYFVKGRSATRKGLINEWLCANLALALGLPIAPFAIAVVPEEIIESDLDGKLRDLGPGEVFASRRVSATELNHAQIDAVPPAQRRDVLLFDWWVRNEDRCLTAFGGNVNLLWNPAIPINALDAETEDSTGLVVIDHNLAFDESFNAAKFCEVHVFADDIRPVFSDFLLRETYKTRFAQAMAVWQDACDNLPSAWGFIDVEETLPTEYPFAHVKAILDLAQTEDFWTLPT